MSELPPSDCFAWFQLEALMRVGREKRTRWLNDKLLRDMAGALTARDMDALFKPVPFGETGHVTALSEAVTAENQALWDIFRSINYDRQSRVLEVRCSVGWNAWQQPAVPRQMGDRSEAGKRVAGLHTLKPVASCLSAPGFEWPAAQRPKRSSDTQGPLAQCVCYVHRNS